MASKKGNGVREVSPGKFVATMYSPLAKGGTKHIGTFTVGEGRNQYATRTLARKAAEEAKREAEKQRDRQLKSTEDETCGSFARRWPRDYTDKRGVSTIEHNTERTRAFIRDFGDRPLRDIQPIEARAWIQGGIVPPQIRPIARHWHKARVLPDGDVEVPEHRSWQNVIRAMFNDALRTELIVRNPFADLRIAQSQGRSGDAITILTEAELAQLIETCHRTLGGYGHHFGAFLEALAWTGLRPGEAYALDIEHLDFAKGAITVEAQIDKRGRRRPPKWNSKRTVFMLPEAATALRRAIDGRDRGPVFLNKRDENRLTQRSSGYYWGQVRAVFWESLPAGRKSVVSEKDGGPELGKVAVDFDLYELRHWFGTFLGCDLELAPPKIAKLMGHKDGGELAMRRYIHASDDGVQVSLLERHADLQRRKALRASG
jgi:integrase